MHQNNPVPVTTHGPPRNHAGPPQTTNCTREKKLSDFRTAASPWIHAGEVASGSPSLWMGQRNPRTTNLGGWNPINHGMFTIYQLVQDFAGPSTVGVPFLLNSYQILPCCFPSIMVCKCFHCTAPCSADYAPLRLTERNNYDAHGKNKTQFKNYMIWWTKKRFFPFGITT